MQHFKLFVMAVSINHIAFGDAYKEFKKINKVGLTSTNFVSANKPKNGVLQGPLRCVTSEKKFTRASCRYSQVSASNGGL